MLISIITEIKSKSPTMNTKITVKAGYILVIHALLSMTNLWVQPPTLGSGQRTGPAKWK